MTDENNYNEKSPSVIIPGILEDLSDGQNVTCECSRKGGEKTDDMSPQITESCDINEYPCDNESQEHYDQGVVFIHLIEPDCRLASGHERFVDPDRPKTPHGVQII